MDAQRLAALAPYTALGALTQQAFDRAANLAADLFQVPIVFVSLVDGEFERMIGARGTPLRTIERPASLGSLVVEAEDVLSTADLAEDTCTGAPQVAQANHPVRFYAGAPLVNPHGVVLGALSIADTQPRPELEGPRRDALRHLAALVVGELEAQLEIAAARRMTDASTRRTENLRDELAASNLRQGVAELLDLGLSPAETLHHVVELTASTLDADWGGLVAVHGDRAFSVTAWATPAAREVARLADGGTKREDGGLIWQAASSSSPIFVNDYPRSPAVNPVFADAGVRAIAYAPLGPVGEVSYLLGVNWVQRASPWEVRDRQLLQTVVQMVRQTLKRMEDQEALRQSRLHLQLALNAAPLTLWATDLSGTVTLAEGRGLRALCYGRQNVVGEPATSVFARTPHVLENLDRALRGETLTTRDVTDTHVYEAQYAPLHNRFGQQIGVVGTAYDVTELTRVRLEAERARQQAEVLLTLAHTLVSDRELAETVEAALRALEPVVGETALVLWQGEGDVFLPLARQGEFPPEVWERMSRGVPAARLQPFEVLGGRDQYLTLGDFPEEARQPASLTGLWGVALLPVLLEPSGPQLILAAYRFGPFDGWSALDRELLGAAAHTLASGIRHQRYVRRLQQGAAHDLTK